MLTTIIELTISILSLVSVFLAGKKNILAWPTLILAHSIFLGYTFVMDTDGFSILNVGMIAIAINNWVLWRRDKVAMKEV